VLAVYNETVQYADGSTWSIYTLSPGVTLNGPGDVLIAVVDRFVNSGVTPPNYPAALDGTSTNLRSWAGWWNADPPDPPVLPPDLTFDLVDNFGFPGNWLLRGLGETLFVPPSTMTMTFQVTVTAQPGAEVINEVMADYNGTMLMSEHMLTVLEPSLYITKTAAPASQYAGQPVTYTLVFGNGGPADAMGVTVSDTLPVGVEYVSSDPMGVYDPVAHEVVWAGLDLAAGAEIEANIVVRIDEMATPATWLTNTAWLMYEYADPISSTATHYILPPDILRYYLPLIFQNYLP
jgi:uncharacterized repeat protein (TIGR01451 family)